MAEATVQEQLNILSNHMTKLIDHIAEVRASNRRLEAKLTDVETDVATLKSDVATVKSDVASLDAKLTATETKLSEQIAGVDRRITHLSGRLDHWIEVFSARLGKTEISVEDTAYAVRANHKETQLRFQQIETRLNQLEAQRRESATA